MLAALADGVSTIAGYAPGADCAATLACLQALGATVRRTGADTVEIEGRGVRGLQAPAAPLDAANSGHDDAAAGRHPRGPRLPDRRSAATRSLSRRPMRRVIEPLTTHGGADRLRRRPAAADDRRRRPAPITYTPDVPSAQVKSAVLLAGLQTAGRTTVIEPAATRDHTERALDAFGAQVDVAGLTDRASTAASDCSARRLEVPGDMSSATFWMALAAGTPGVGDRHRGRRPESVAHRVLDVLRRAGARGRWIDVQAGGTAANRRRAPRPLRRAAQLRHRAGRRAGHHRRDPRARRAWPR